MVDVAQHLTYTSSFKTTKNVPCGLEASDLVRQKGIRGKSFLLANRSNPCLLFRLCSNQPSSHPCSYISLGINLNSVHSGTELPYRSFGCSTVRQDTLTPADGTNIGPQHSRHSCIARCSSNRLFYSCFGVRSQKAVWSGEVWPAFVTLRYPL